MADKPAVLRETDDDARRQARILLRGARSVSLGVLEPGGAGFPFVSRALAGIDTDGVPVILVSALSTHTQALLADGRSSLLAGEPGKGDPLAHPRLTVQCEATRVDRDSPSHSRIRERFIRRHPKAELYVDFPDFAFFRLTPLRASLNGGFGRAYVLEGSDLIHTSPAIAALAAMEEDAIAHMNTDHRDALARYAQSPEGAGLSGWTLVGIDVGGIDLASGDLLRRLEFSSPLDETSQLHALLVEFNR